MPLGGFSLAYVVSVSTHIFSGEQDSFLISPSAILSTFLPGHLVHHDGSGLVFTCFLYYQSWESIRRQASRTKEFSLSLPLSVSPWVHIWKEGSI